MNYWLRALEISEIKPLINRFAFSINRTMTMLFRRKSSAGNNIGLNINRSEKIRPASLSSGNMFVSGAEDLRFDSRSGQIGRRVANGLPRCYISLKGPVLPGRNDAKMSPPNSLHASAKYSEYNKRLDLTRNTSSENFTHQVHTWTKNVKDFHHFYATLSVFEKTVL